MSTLYRIHKCVEQPLVFQGLKGFYIWVAGCGLVMIFLLFALLYLLGISLLICVFIAIISCIGLLVVVSKHSRQYGLHGWMKKTAAGNIPNLQL